MYHFFEFFDLIPTEAKYLLSIGLVSLLLATLLFIRKSRGLTFFLFLSAFLVASAFALIDPFLHTWDESFHALVAKNASDGYFSPHLLNDDLVAYNPKIWVGNYIWLHKPPLALWQMGISIDLFGNSIYAVRLPSVLLFSFTVLLVYDLAKMIFSRTVAFYSAVMVILFQFLLEQIAGVHTSDHVDVSFLFYITGSLWSWFKYSKTEKRFYLYLIGIFIGLAILTKWLVGLLIFGAWSVLIIFLLLAQRSAVLKQLKDALTSFFVALLVALPWNIYAAINYSTEYWHELKYSSRHFYEVIEGHSGGGWFYWHNLSTLFGEGALIPVIVILSLISLVFTLRNKIDRIVILAFILLPYIFFTIATTKMSNFVNIVSPLIIICIAAMFVRLFKVFDSRVRLNSYFSLLIIPFLFVFLLRPNQSIKNHLFHRMEQRIYYKKSQAFIKELNGNSADLYVYSGFSN